MKQRVTRELFGYWDALRGGRKAPDRGNIDPGAIRSCLPDTFVLGVDLERGHPLRIAGTAICSLFGRELTKTPFVRLWDVNDRGAIADMVRTVVDRSEVAVTEFHGRNADEETVGLEMILLPLCCADAGASRILGALTPLAAPYWLGARSLETLHLGTRHNGAAVLPAAKFRCARAAFLQTGQSPLPEISRNNHG